MEIIKKLDPPAVLAMLFVSAIVLFVGFGIASAATITGIEFSNGAASIQGNPGQSFSATVSVDLATGDTPIELVVSDITGDVLPAALPVSVGSNNGFEGPMVAKILVQGKFPLDAGDYGLFVDFCGIAGSAFRAITCSGNSVVSTTFGGALKVVGTGSGSSSSGGFGGPSYQELVDMIKELTLQLTALKAQIATPPAPAKPAYCASMTWYNGSNAWLAQASLLASPHAPFFNEIGVYSPTGNWKSASQAAAAAASAACK